jgi:hypothetical protein
MLKKKLKMGFAIAHYSRLSRIAGSLRISGVHHAPPAENAGVSRWRYH